MHPIPLTKAVISVGSENDLESVLASSHLGSWLEATLPILRQGGSQALPSNRSSPQDLHTATIEGRLVLTEPVLQGLFQPLLTSFFLTHHPSTHHPPTLENESDDLDIEISEGFLQGPLSLPTSSMNAFEKSEPRQGPSQITSSQGSRDPPYDLLPLNTPLYALHDDTALYVRTKHLSQIGALQGEWVNLHSTLPRNTQF